MAINRTSTAKKENVEKEELIAYKVKVLKVTPRPKREGCYRFSLEVNGVTIYGMEYITYTSKQGEERTFISFPQYQDKDQNYWNHCYFPINDPKYASVKEDIERQIENLL